MWINRKPKQPVENQALIELLGAPIGMQSLVDWVDRQYTLLQSQRELVDTQVNTTEHLKALLKLDAFAMGQIDMQLVSETVYAAYRIQKLLFQTQEGVYVPANLYIPSGVGPFPAVLHSHGHWAGGKMGTIIQQTAQRFVQAGYVVLCIDAWGAGERGTAHCDEYHGANLGAALFDAGTSLLAMQLLDNRQAISLLRSLEMVDRERIGALGASGGGNQTLWLSAIDERVKAVLPVASVGTCKGYLLERNCVCETLPKGLTTIEMADVVGAIAPRPVQLFTALQEDIPAFQVGQMMRVYERAKVHYTQLGYTNNLSYTLFDEGHHFSTAMQEAAVAFFNACFSWQHPTAALQQPDLPGEAVLAVGKQPLYTGLNTTSTYLQACAHKSLLALDAQPSIDVQGAKEQLADMLCIKTLAIVSEYNEAAYPAVGWSRILLHTGAGYPIHCWVKMPKTGQSTRLYIPAGGLATVSAAMITHYAHQEEGIVLLELFGMREQARQPLQQLDEELTAYHTLARTLLWLDHTLIGYWVSEIQLLLAHLRPYGVEQVIMQGERETALALLCHEVLYPQAQEMLLIGLPLSLLPVNSKKPTGTINMAMHIPGILPWGDVSLLRALVNSPMHIEAPIDMSGHVISEANAALYRARIKTWKDKLENET